MELGKSDLADSDKRLARHVLEPREVDVLERAHLQGRGGWRVGTAGGCA